MANPNDATPLPETLPDPFSDVHVCGDTPQDIVARAIRRDAKVVGVFFDADFARELADAVLDGLHNDEAQIDALSFVFDSDVRRALAA